jgi:hypothetical protein
LYNVTANSLIRAIRCTQLVVQRHRQFAYPRNSLYSISWTTSPPIRLSAQFVVLN